MRGGALMSCGRLGRSGTVGLARHVHAGHRLPWSGGWENEGAQRHYKSNTHKTTPRLDLLNDPNG
jgi:hypothetical protein